MLGMEVCTYFYRSSWTGTYDVEVDADADADAGVFEALFWADDACDTFGRLVESVRAPLLVLALEPDTGFDDVLDEDAVPFAVAFEVVFVFALVLPLARPLPLFLLLGRVLGARRRLSRLTLSRIFFSRARISSTRITGFSFSCRFDCALTPSSSQTASLRA